ncbi:hypothetical protein PHLCEN_2v9438 [Hermanssonia centrifuga]|uniref:Uncharacterized protein n=1 Tax=Hermanssonia centrifuga TaxID=98765 RepID=A0A2R6NQP3_9APHY|nr:hypothetical protein PHLCEN_2v9438 [Hermanssonia centrifuga]
MTAALIFRTQQLEQRLALYESQRDSTPPVPSPPADVSSGSDMTMELFDFAESSSFLVGPMEASTPLIIPDIPVDPLFDMDSLHPSVVMSRMLLPNPPLHFSDTSAIPMQNTFELRSTFLAHNVQLGLYLRDSKWKAVKEGDYSGRDVHPALVHLAQLIGGTLWKMHNKSDPLIVQEDVELQNVLRALEEPSDPSTQLLVYCLLAWYAFFIRNIEEANKYLVKGLQVILDHNLGLIMPGTETILPMEEPDEDAKEQITAMSQLLYLDKAATIVLNTPSVFDDNYDRQIKVLPLVQPWLSKHSVVLMRARSVYFLQQALRLSRIQWYSQYWDTLEEVSQHVSLLVPQMLKSTLCADPRHGVSLKVCIMIALAAMVELHRLPATYHAESRQKVVDVVMEIVGLTRGFKEEDFVLLDPILGTCWTVVATALCQERQSFVEIAQMEPDAQWGEAFTIMITCASKLGTKLPYMGESLRAHLFLSRF